VSATLLDSEGDQVSTWAGFVSARRNRRTGTLVVVVDDRTGTWTSDSLDPVVNAPWLTICDDHATICCHSSRKLATSHAAFSEGWCEQCMEVVS